VLEATIATLNPVMRSIAAIFAGIAAFFAVGGIAFGAIYVALVYLLPRPVDLLEFNVNAGLGFLVIVAVGSIASGFVTARTAERARFLHSAVAFVLLSALRRAYMLWGPDTFIWDDGDWGTIQLMVIASLPFFSLGTWLGSRKREQVEKSA
jgi:hypothetical protein